MSFSFKNHLKNSTLFREEAYIDGEWIKADNGNVLSVTNPATGDAIGTIPNLARNQIRKAINKASETLKIWSSKTAKERAIVLKKFYDLMIENQEDLAHIMTIEQGKPLAESRGEILYAASFIEWFAEEGKRIYGDIIPTFAADKRILVLKQAIGVCVAITPWNFPSAMITRKCGPALAAGCPIVIKPASETPFSALALAVLAEEAGIPKGVFNVVTGSASEIGKEFCENPIVRKLSFTGSTEIGRLLMKQSAQNLQKLSLELGGHAPFIVFKDADIDQAIEGALISKYRNSGQTCVCANRFYIHEDIYDAFATKFKNKIADLKVGNGLDNGISLGPLIDQKAVDKAQEHIDDAIKKGSKLLFGGQKHQLGRTFFEPTLLSDVPQNALISSEETFGPVAPLYKFKEEDEVLNYANNSDYGLAAYFYGRDIGQIWRVAEGLDYGIIGINVGVISTEVAPFGGMKQSGFGREGSKYGIEDYLEIKYLCLGGLA